MENLQTPFTVVIDCGFESAYFTHINLIMALEFEARCKNQPNNTKQEGVVI